MSSFDLKALENCFKQSGIKDSFESLYHTLGFITAMASSPEPVQPTEWIEQLVTTDDKQPRFDSEQQVKVFTSNLVTWWDQCNQLFDRGGTIQLPNKLGLTPTGKPNKSLVEFSTGYLDGFDWLFDTWQALLPNENEEAHRTLSVLNFILARFVDENKMAKADPELYKQLPDTEGCLRVLANLLSGVGMLGKDIALPDEDFDDLLLDGDDEESEPKSAAQLPFKSINKSVGRNDPCPCGSGKKFKKCCLH
ncbi:MAG: UPF0149 family protein [Kangiellaceae bacterium]|nr:UPF0149 family protein [Kangiellaceae bacterium]